MFDPLPVLPVIVTSSTGQCNIIIQRVDSIMLPSELVDATEEAQRLLNAKAVKLTVRARASKLRSENRVSSSLHALRMRWC
jgi:hypothetical protein